MISSLKLLVTTLWHSPTLTTWGSFAARSLSLVLVLPLILRRLAPAEFAVWSLFTTIVSLQLLAELGFGVTFARAVAYAMGGASRLERVQAFAGSPGTGEPNWDLLTRILATMRTIYGRLTAILAVLLVIGGTVALWRPIGRMELPSDGWIAWSLVVAATVVSFRANQFGSFLLGVNQVALLRRWETAFALGGIGTTLLVIGLTNRLSLLLAASQAWVLLTAWRNRRLARYVLSGRFNRLPSPRVCPEIMSAVWPSAWRSGIGSAMSLGLLQLSGVFYAQSANLASINSYLLGLRLIQAISQFSQAPFYSKLPLFSRLWAQGRRDELLATAARSMAFAYWAFVIPFLFLSWLGPAVAQIIGSSAPFPEPTMWILLGGAFLTERYGGMHMQLFSLSNQITWHIANGVTGSLMLVLWLVLVPVLGATGFPMGMWVAYALFYSSYSSRKSHKLLGLPFPQFDSKTLGGALLVAVGTALALGLATGDPSGRMPGSGLVDHPTR